MRDITLVRLTNPMYNFPTGGALVINAEPSIVTLEPPFFHGYPSEHPCIPTGEYTCKKVFDRETLGGAFIPITYEVTNVPERTGILFHVGNARTDTMGCILLGLSYIKVNGKLGITDSRVAFKRFIEAMEKDNEFTLKVIQV